jgi:hypothetical protein
LQRCEMKHFREPPREFLIGWKVVKLVVSVRVL